MKWPISFFVSVFVSLFWMCAISDLVIQLDMLFMKSPSQILAALVSFPAAIQVLQFETGSFLDYALIWLGVSIGMHSFPSTVDAKGIWAAAWAPTTSLPIRLIALPIVALIYVGAIGSVFWLDAIYGGLVAMAVPTLIITLLA
jgi:hypothetical protein